MSVAPARQPGGAPAGIGGEFAERYYPTVDIPLNLDSGGTYAYPSSPETADEFVEFWRTVEIPEHVLRRVDAAYKEAWNARRTYLGIEFEQANPIPWREKERAAYEERKEAYKREKLANLPASIHPTQVRPLVRVAKMHWASRHLPPAELAKFQEMTFQVPGETKRTAAKLVAAWELEKIAFAFKDEGDASDQLLNRLDG